MIISINYVLIAVVSFVISLITVYAISRLRNPKLLRRMSISHIRCWCLRLAESPY